MTTKIKSFSLSLMAALFLPLLLESSSMTGECNAQSTPQPPTAKRIEKKLVTHGHDRVDHYYWLNQREDPTVIDYLKEENAYTKQVLAGQESFEKELFQEIKSRIKEDDSSVPYKYNGYWYYRRYETGKQYAIHCRKKGSLEASEEILLDVNKLADGHSFCNVTGVSVSPNGELLSYSVDFKGRRQYTAHFVNLATGEAFPDKIENIAGGCVWAKDNQTVFFTRKDPQTLRAFQVYRHRLGTETSADQLVFEEKDEEFYCYVTRSRSKDYILIGSFQTLSSEYRILSADDPEGEFQVFSPRQKDHEYTLDHQGGKFYVLSNWKAENFQLYSTDRPGQSVADWNLLLKHRADTLLEDVDLFDEQIVVTERRNASVHIRVFDKDMASDYYLKFDDPAYVAQTSVTPDPSSNSLRYTYTSLTTPFTVFEHQFESKERKTLKTTEVPGDFQSKNYQSQRLWAEGRDGTKIPVSIVYKKTTKLDGTAPCLQYAYGSYGSSTDPYFSSANLSLLDRGFVYAIAHIRGGQEMGRAWYDDGKLLKKKNTFNDFIDVSKHLIREKICDSKRLYARGGSAGGLLMGAIINQQPELYHGVVADVPFVDVVTTMLDDTIPLTTFEYDEWGNPNNKAYYDYMLSYSPYDQVESKNYPNLLVTTGLHDSQVQYWEPAKWVAKLRYHYKGKNIILLKTNMDAGHGGASGRFDRYKEVATRFAFLIHLAAGKPFLKE